MSGESARFTAPRPAALGVRWNLHRYPALLLDEPTASLDPANRDTVLSLIAEAKAAGVAIVGIFHDADARARVADREIDVAAFSERAA